MSPLPLIGIGFSVLFTWFCLIPAIFWPIRHTVQKLVMLMFVALMLGKCTGLLTWHVPMPDHTQKRAATYHRRAVHER